MISSKEISFEQDNPVPNGTECTALYSDCAEYDIDLRFEKGEVIKIVEPCNVLFYYVGVNSRGKEGVIPINYFKFDLPKPQAEKPDQLSPKPAPLLTDDAAQGPPPVSPRLQRPVTPGGTAILPQGRGLPPKPKPKPRFSGSSTMPRTVRNEVNSIHASVESPPTKPKYDDSNIDRRAPMPLPPEAQGSDATTPVLQTELSPKARQEVFETTSGWFNPGINQVLEQKAGYEISRFAKCAVYLFAHKYDTRLKYCGCSQDPLPELVTMFTQLHYTAHPNALEAALIANPDASNWQVRFNPTTADKLTLTLAQKIIEYNTLTPNGLNPKLALNSKEDWEQFNEWFMGKQRVK